MAPDTSPPGKSFAERWPHDASEREYLAAPWLPIVLGGMAGLFAVPALLAQLFITVPVPVLVLIFANVALTTLAIGRAEGRPSRWLVRLWKVWVWVAAAIVLGLAVSFIGVALCDGTACAGEGRTSTGRAIAMAVTFAASIGGALAITLLVERAARRLVARGRASAT